MKIIQVEKKDVINLLAKGEVCCIATDTIFALTCDARKGTAVKKIFSIKNRDYSKTLPLLCASFQEAQKYAFFSNEAEILAKRFWPGKLTMILPFRTNDESELIAKKYCVKTNDNNEEIAIRVPSSSDISDILLQISFPLIGTSANISNMKEEKNIKEVLKQISETHISDSYTIYFSDELLTLLPDNSQSSTIFHVNQKRILREGVIKKKDIDNALLK